MLAKCLYCSRSFKKRRSTSKYCCRSCQSFDFAKKGISCKKPKTGKNFMCKFCQKEFYAPNWRIQKGKVQFCSRNCLAKVHLPKYAEFAFKSTGRPPHKYKTIKVNGKWVREHRFIMENQLGRKLETWEHVHHIDGDSFNNSLENLVVLSNSEHQKLEHKDRKKILGN